MRVLIGTPAYGGLVYTDYLVSMITTTRGFIRDGVDFVVNTLGNESLINRARNSIADFAVKENFDKLVFIDADIGWNWDDMVNLLNSQRRIVGGTYPLKTLPKCLNFNPLPDHFGIFEEPHPTGPTYKKTEDKFKLYKEKYADANGEVEVMHIPTGFLSINVDVLKELKPKVEAYAHRDFRTGVTSEISDYFPIRVHNKILESEDWAFCSIARENGIPVYFNTNIVVSHSGTYTFK